MGILGTIKLIFTALGKLFGFLKDRQLIKAGEDKAKLAAAEKIAEHEEIANNAPADPALRDFVRDKYDRSK